MPGGTAGAGKAAAGLEMGECARKSGRLKGFDHGSRIPWGGIVHLLYIANVTTRIVWRVAPFWKGRRQVERLKFRDGSGFEPTLSS